MTEIINSKFILNNKIKNTSEFRGPSTPDDIIVYEVVRLIDGKVLFLNDHLERFFSSFSHVDKKTNITKEYILNHLNLLIEANQIAHGNIKFHAVVNLTSGNTNFFAYFIPHAYPSEYQYKNGVPVSMFRASRINPNAKVQQTKLRNELNIIIKNNNVYEVLLVHPDGYVTEGSRSNLFMIKNNSIFTSLESDILPGITRKYIIELCHNLNLPIYFQRITPEETLAMHALFITGTSPKVLPVCSISDAHFDVNHPILRKVMNEFDQLVELDLKNSINFLKQS